ncbi:hypothetical protein BCR35DRAFT_350523 [Leucosporidium creatinivorum]|uniref:Uncharacterized protein n=1 Tax=Leucosporidium creatinivorum TaxID=106004 RepID=A0A1Y2G057_9BASI|nr:hypothetical protein BCR35DRAFT_350523 [Leucosporidium creatinivorum]
MESTPSPTGSQKSAADLPSTLLSLPTEVLARIVELSARQDESYWERVLAAATDRELEMVHLLDGAGMSLSNLSLVNKQLHGLCCAHLFKTLRSSRAILPAFRYYVCAAYSRHFTRVIFDNDTEEEALAYTLSSSTAFPNLRSLSVHRAAAIVLLGKSLTKDDVLNEDEEKDARKSTFRRLAAKVPRLALLGPFRGEAATMLRCFANLTSLELAIHSPDQNKDGGLTNALASLTNLRRLSLAATNLQGRLNAAWGETRWAFEETLTSFALKMEKLDAATWSFGTRFTSSLQQLRLEFDDASIPHLDCADSHSVLLACEAQTHPWSIVSACKALHTLHLCCPAPAALAILGGLLAHGDSKLRRLDLSLEDLPDIQWDDEDASPRLSLLLLAPSLTRLSLTSLSSHIRMPSVSTLALRAFCDAQGITLDSQSGLWEPFLRTGRGSEGVLRSAFTDRRCDVAKEILEWAVRYNERLRSTEDAEGVEDLLGLLENLKARKMLEED